MKIGLDVDDVLLPCTSIVVEMLEDMGIRCEWDEVLWRFVNLSEHDQRVARTLVNTPKLFQKQIAAYEGAQELVRALLERGHEVYFCTAVPTWEVEHRSRQLEQFFPEVPSKNYVFCRDKSVIALDVLLDDAPHNITESVVPVPVVYDMPWNRAMKNTNAAAQPIKRVCSYKEFLQYVDYIDSLGMFHEIPEPSEPETEKKPAPANQIFCLVGPSASGKTTMAEMLAKTGEYKIPVSVTTREKRVGERDDAYIFVSKDRFAELVDRGEMIESTLYNGNSYGLARQVVNDVLNTGKDIVVPVDIKGAEALKKAYPGRVTSIFVLRDPRDILKSLAERNLDFSVLMDRLESLRGEFGNSERCDYTLTNYGTVEEVAARLKTLIQGIKELQA